MTDAPWADSGADSFEVRDPEAKSRMVQDRLQREATARHEAAAHLRRLRPWRLRRGDNYRALAGSRHYFVVYDWGGDTYIVHLYSNEKSRDWAVRNFAKKQNHTPVASGRVFFKKDCTR